MAGILIDLRCVVAAELDEWAMRPANLNPPHPEERRLARLEGGAALSFETHR
jgi:hypothetical protein